jgi:hypothetical protein
MIRLVIRRRSLVGRRGLHALGLPFRLANPSSALARAVSAGEEPPFNLVKVEVSAGQSNIWLAHHIPNHTSAHASVED